MSYQQEERFKKVSVRSVATCENVWLRETFNEDGDDADGDAPLFIGLRVCKLALTLERPDTGDWDAIKQDTNERIASAAERSGLERADRWL